MSTASRNTLLVGALGLAALAVLIVLFASQRTPREITAPPATPPETPAGDTAVEMAEAPVEAQPPYAVPIAEPAAGRDEIAPFDARTVQKLQDAINRNMAQQMEGQSGVIYPVAASLAVRGAIVGLGYEPDRTLLYWLSDQFRADLQAAGPQEVASTGRAVDGLVAMALADGVGDQEFAEVMAHYSPEVRAAAEQRRRAMLGGARP